MNRIKSLRNSRGMKQIDLCKTIGITQGALSGWENGKYEPDNVSLIKMSEIFNVTIDYLLGNPEKERIMIPVLGYVKAGIPLEAIEEILDYEEISKEMSSHGEHFGLVIKGDSMAPRFIENDVVIVRKQSDVDSGDIAVVIINGQDATVKKIKKIGTSLMLMPLNNSYEPVVYDINDIESLPVEIKGKVVELRGKF